MYKITVPAAKIESQMDEIQLWVQLNAGLGSTRFGGKKGSISHWLNGEDWLYYQEYIIDDDTDVIGTESDYVFIFKDSKTATEFALRFA